MANLAADEQDRHSQSQTCGDVDVPSHCRCPAISLESGFPFLAEAHSHIASSNKSWRSSGLGAGKRREMSCAGP